MKTDNKTIRIHILISVILVMPHVISAQESYSYTMSGDYTIEKIIFSSLCINDTNEHIIHLKSTKKKVKYKILESTSCCYISYKGIVYQIGETIEVDSNDQNLTLHYIESASRPKYMVGYILLEYYSKAKESTKLRLDCYSYQKVITEDFEVDSNAVNPDIYDFNQKCQEYLFICFWPDYSKIVNIPVGQDFHLYQKKEETWIKIKDVSYEIFEPFEFNLTEMENGDYYIEYLRYKDRTPLRVKYYFRIIK